MIFDDAKYLDFYAKNDPKLQVVVDFLKTNPMEELQPGRYDLDKGVYALVNESATRTEGPYEVHRKYADLQLMVRGGEIIEWALLDDMTNGNEYNEEGDCQLFECAPASAIGMKLLPGRFAILYPQDAHKPLIRIEADSVRKIIFKIPV